MKRTILKKISGARKDGANWYGVVLSSAYNPETSELHEEHVAFVEQAIYEQLEEGGNIILK